MARHKHDWVTDGYDAIAKPRGRWNVRYIERCFDCGRVQKRIMFREIDEAEKNRVLAKLNEHLRRSS